MANSEVICRVRALYDFNSSDPSALVFEAGTEIDVLQQLESGWWDGWSGGERGWFPCNYVEVISESAQDNAPSEPIASKTTTQQSNTAAETSARAQKSYGDWQAQTTPDGVPFWFNVKTSQATWELPAENSVEEKPSTEDDIKARLMQNLPAGWELQSTEDGSEYYYYNPATGQMRYRHPLEPGSDDDLGPADQNENLSQFEDADRPIHPEVEGFTTAQPTVEDISEDEELDHIERGKASSDMMILSTYLHNKLDGGRFDSTQKKGRANGHSSTPSFNGSLTDRQWQEIMEKELTRENPLTWKKLANGIANPIQSLNQAIDNEQYELFGPRVRDVVTAIRFMFYAAGAIDWQRQDTVPSPQLRHCQKAITTSLSRLLLATKTAEKGFSDTSYIAVRSSVSSLLDAIRNFVNEAQDSNLTLNHITPHMLENVPRWRQRNLPVKLANGQEVFPYATRYITGNQRLDQQALAALGDILNLIRTSCKSIQEHSTNIVATRAKNDGSLNVAIPNVIAQFRLFSQYVSQFVSIVEAISAEVESSQPLFASERRLLYNCLGRSFLAIQEITSDNGLQRELDTLKETLGNLDETLSTICNQVAQILQVGAMRNARKPAPLAAVQAPMSPRPRSTYERFEFPDEDDDPYDNMSDAHSTAPTLISTNNGSQPLGRVMDSDLQLDRDLGNISSDSEISINSLLDKAIEQSQNVELDQSGELAKSKSSVMSPSETESPSASQFEDLPFLRTDYTIDNDIIINRNGAVKGGTLKALVERLTLHDSPDTKFMATFLLTYRSFCTSQEFFELLKQRYLIEPPSNLSAEELKIWDEKKRKPIRLRVLNVFKSWIENYFNEEEDQMMLQNVKYFTDTTIKQTMPFAVGGLSKSIEKRFDPGENGFRKMVLNVNRDPPAPIMPKNMRRLRLLDIDPLELARQLTIMDSKLYNSIQPVECLNKAWSTNDVENSAFNVKASIEYSNQVTAWVSDSILSQVEPKKRLAVLKHWILVAEHCRTLQNYNTCMAILASFESSAIGRLKRTWDMCSGKTNQILAGLKKVLATSLNFTEYREIIHSINPPCIPFLGIFLQDLTFIEDGNPDYLRGSDGDLINFSKRMKTAEVIRDLQQYQNAPYALTTVMDIQHFISSHLKSSRDEVTLYNMSLDLEPRQREDEKIARMLQQSGFL